MAIGFVAILTTMGACDDPPRTCKLQPGDSPAACSDAVVLTLRETSSFFPPDDEIVAMYDFLARVRPLSCYFDRTFAVYAYGDVNMPVIASTNPLVVKPWMNQQVATGDAAVDALFSDRGAYRVYPFHTGNRFKVVFDLALNWDVLADEVMSLADTSVVREDFYDWFPKDIRRTRAESDDAWIVTFDYAWGDCSFSGCDGVHQFDVRVPDDGSAPEIIDDSGDAIPSELDCPT